MIAATLLVFRVVYTLIPPDVFLAGWAGAIAGKAPELMIVLLCAPLFRSGVTPRFSWRSTVEGVWLDWPELAFATWVLISAVAAAGLPNGIFWPLLLALAVGTGEEFLFRVLLLGWLLDRLSPFVALLAGSAVFGLAHLHEVSLVGLVSVAPQFCGGMVLGAIYMRTRNPLGPILCHAFWDLPYFLVLGANISGGGTEGGMPPLVATLVPWGLYAVYGIFLIRQPRHPVAYLGPRFRHWRGRGIVPSVVRDMTKTGRGASAEVVRQPANTRTPPSIPPTSAPPIAPIGPSVSPPSTPPATAPPAMAIGT